MPRISDLPTELLRIIASFVGWDLKIPFRLEFYRQHINHIPRRFLIRNHSLPSCFKEEFDIQEYNHGWHSDSLMTKARAKEAVHYGVEWNSPTKRFDIQRAHLPFFCDFVPERIISYIIIHAEPERIPWNSICSNPHLPVSFYRDHFDYIQWDFLSKNRGDLVELYDQYPDKLDWEFISQNPSVPLWFYEKYVTRLNWYAIARNYGLPLQIMTKEVREYLIAL